MPTHDEEPPLEDLIHDVLGEEEEMSTKKRAKLKAYKPLGSLSQACFCLFTVVFIVGGIVFIVMGAQGMMLAQVSTVCACRITEFQASQIFAKIGDPVPTCSDVPGFVVKANCPDVTQLTAVHSWAPEFEESYHSETGSKPVHAAFKCCPESLADTCAFKDPETGKFCDDLGGQQDGCPSNPWSCYFKTLDLASIRQEDGNLPAEELRVGDPNAELINFLIGFPLLVLGIILFIYVVFDRHWSLKQAAASVVETKAVTSSGPAGGAIAIRGVDRKPIARKGIRLTKGEQATVHHQAEAGARDLPSSFVMPPEIPSEETPTEKKEDTSDLLEDMQAAGIEEGSKVTKEMSIKAQERRAEEKRRTMEEDERLRKIAKMAEMYEKDPHHHELYLPERQGPSPKHGVLYDTGSTSTFRRMACTRMASDPGEETLRLEVAINEPARGLDRIFRVTDKSAGSKLLIDRRPPKFFADVYGLRKGQRCVRVGHLSWPEATGRELLEAFLSAPRPVFLVLEARIEDLEQLPSSMKEPRRAQVNPNSPNWNSWSGGSPNWSTGAPGSPSGASHHPWYPTSPISTYGGLSGSMSVNLPGVVPQEGGSQFQTPRSPAGTLRAAASSCTSSRSPTRVGIGGAR